MVATLISPRTLLTKKKIKNEKKKEAKQMAVVGKRYMANGLFLICVSLAPLDFVITKMNAYQVDVLYADFGHHFLACPDIQHQV